MKHPSGPRVRPPQPGIGAAAWQRLAALAASAPQEVPGLPHGLATRVVARWKERCREAELRLWETREAFAWRGAAIAMAITFAALAANYDFLMGLWYGDTALAGSVLQTFAAP